MAEPTVDSGEVVGSTPTASSMKKTRNIWDSNRTMASKSSAKGGHWCMSCDEHFIREGQRCPTCKNQDKRKHKNKYN